jgi:ABC-2 type transport system permease protein
MDGFSEVLWAGRPLMQLLPTLGVLLAMTAGVMTIAIWRINQKKIFG